MKKNINAAELSRMGASKGGQARAASLTPAERSEIARRASDARWGKSPRPRATHDGHLEVLNLSCAVLEDETRVISERAFSAALGSPRGGMAYAAKRDGGADLPVFLAGKQLRPFIDNDLMAALTPIEYIPKHGGRTAFGVPAEIVPRICEVWLLARDAGVLTHRQVEVAKRADLLLRGFAHTGIIALVDEATGFQDSRARDALAKILEKFIAKELRPWVKTFPVDYYREIYRLRGWEFPPESNRHNSNLGKFTNNLIYARLAPGVKRELNRLAPRNEKGRLKHKLFQHLSEDIGHPKLREHIGSVVMALKISKTWEELMAYMDQFLPKYPDGPTLPFGE